VTGLALAALRTRWVTVVGAFIALTLGVGMISTVALVLGGTMSADPRPPERYAAAPVVVVGEGELTVDRGEEPATVRRDTPAPLPADLVSRLAAVGPVVEDRTFYAQLTGADAGADQVGHPWSAAALTPYTLTEGRPPRADNEVVLPGDARLGERVTVLTSAGPRPYTVVGAVRPVGFESAVFFNDAEAARLSPPVNAVIVDAAPEAVRQVAGTDVRVLTGVDRRAAEAAADQDRRRLLNTRTLLAVAGGIAAFVAVFVVASTFSFTTSQRRQEFALLRTVGSTPAQIRRMVLIEAALVGLLGSVAGCVLGALAGPALAARLARDDVAPSWFTAPLAVPPLAVSIVVGVGVALLAAWAASRRAGRVSPVEALQTAVVDDSPMTRGRWIAGLALLFCAVGGMLFIARAQPRIATVPVIYLWVLILTVTAVSVLAPAIVPPFTRLLTWPLSWLPGAAGILVRENTLTAVRRTVGTAAPVLLIVGLALSLFGATATIDQARLTERDRLLTADLVVLPDGGPGISPAIVPRIEALGGVEVAAPVPVTVYGYDEDSLRDYDAVAVDPDALGQTLRIEVLAGSIDDLDEGTVAVSDDWETTVGQSVELWLADGRTINPRVAAVVATGIGGPDVYLAPGYAGNELADEVLITVPAGGDADALRGQVAALAGEYGARVAPRAEWVAGGDSSTPGGSAAGLVVMLIVTVLYSGIAMVNTMVMAASGRIREFAVLRLTGATPGQVLRVVMAEALLVVGVGALLAGIATAINLAGLLAALAALVGATPVAMPWLLAGGLVVGSAVLLLVGSVATVRVTMRAPAVQLMGVRE
jgi:putative ABC transport system permease protein